MSELEKTVSSLVIVLLVPKSIVKKVMTNIICKLADRGFVTMVGSQASSISIVGAFVRNAKSQVPLGPAESEILGLGSSHLFCNTFS